MAVTWCLWTTCPSPGDGSRVPDTAPRGPGLTDGGSGPAAGPALPCARRVNASPSSECCKLLPLSQRWVGRASRSPLPTLVTFPLRVGCPHFRQVKASLAFSTRVRQRPFLPSPCEPVGFPAPLPRLLLKNSSSSYSDPLLLRFSLTFPLPGTISPFLCRAGRPGSQLRV